MNVKSGPHRLLWVLGVLVLVGMGIGARFVFNGNHNGGGSEADAEPPGVLAVAHVEPEKGIARLYPGQQGQVAWVIEEGKEVKKDEVLLRLHQELSRAHWERAEADLQDANVQLQRAQNEEANYPLKVDQQTNAIEIAKHTADIAEYDYEQAKEARANKIITEFALKKARANWEKAKRYVKAEEDKLKELNKQDPKLDVERAKANLRAKKGQSDAAKHVLDQTVLKAPSDGKVLRVDTNIGETQPNPRGPAIEFAPKGPRIVKAEVLQEWADRIFKGQEVRIESDPRGNKQWNGKVKSISDWIRQKRNPMLEPFVVNDVRTLEVIIEITSDAKDLRIGQRVRVTFLPGK